MKLRTENAGYVLDSSALIALVHGEPGSEVVREVLGESVVSAVNLTETITKLIRQGGEPRLVERYVRGLSLEVVPWSEELSWAGRDLCQLAWTHGISLADRVCLTLARHLGITAMTSDAEWPKLGVNVRIALFRERRRK